MKSKKGVLLWAFVFLFATGMGEACNEGQTASFNPGGTWILKARPVAKITAVYRDPATQTETGREGVVDLLQIPFIFIEPNAPYEVQVQYDDVTNSINVEDPLPVDLPLDANNVAIRELPLFVANRLSSDCQLWMLPIHVYDFDTTGTKMNYEHRLVVQYLGNNAEWGTCQNELIANQDRDIVIQTLKDSGTFDAREIANLCRIEIVVPQDGSLK